LRLSDGTNVALSLSFFNEQCATEYATFTHNYYDPHRYPEQADSKLGIVVVATTLAAAAAFFSLVQGPLNSLVNPKTAFAFITVPPAKWPAPPPAPKADVAPVKPGAASVAAPRTATKKSPGSSRVKVRQARSRAARTTNSFPRSSVFVPPPPPFAFSLPDGRPLSPYDVFPKMQSPATTSKPAPQVKPANQKPAAQEEPPQAKTVSPAKTAAQSPSPATRTEREPEATSAPPATRSTSVREPAATSSAPPSRSAAVTTTAPPPSHPLADTGNVPEREPARTAIHRSIWERPDGLIAPAQQRAVPVDNQLRAPVPGDDSPAQAPRLSTSEQPAHSRGPVPAQAEYEPIPWPE
jgi:hypothetical protein